MVTRAILWVNKTDTATLVLISLLTIDVLLILVFLSHRLLGWPSSHWFNIGIDRSIPEYFQYLKELSLSAVLFAQFLRQRSTAALLWSVLAAMLLVDDAFQVHEKFGSLIDGVFYFADAYGIRGQDFGEVIAAAVMAGPLLLGLAYCHSRDSASAREFSRNMLLLLIFLGLFGVLIDLFVHALQSLILYVIEDGGEMLVVSLMLWFALRYFLTGRTNLVARIDRIFS